MTTLNLQVNASAGDAWVANRALNNSVQIATTVLTFGNNGAATSFGVRFVSVTIPQGTTLTSATLTLTANATYSGGAISMIVKGQAADNPGVFLTTGKDLDPTVRARTTAASTAWNLASVVADTAYSKDVTSVVQEIINRAGWASGNALVLIGDDNASPSSDWQDMWAYDGSTTKAPKLDIVYGGGGSDVAVFAPRIPPAILAR